METTISTPTEYRDVSLALLGAVRFELTTPLLPKQIQSLIELC
jgi:hypothetical protein